MSRSELAGRQPARRTSGSRARWVSRVRVSHHSTVGGRRVASDWGLALAVAAAVLVYVYRHWPLLETPLRQVVESLR